jgi:hypothetical protein
LKDNVSYSKPYQDDILLSGVHCLLVGTPKQDYRRATSYTTYDATSTAKKATSNTVFGITRQLKWITSKIWQHMHSPHTFCHLESVVSDANQDKTTEELPQIPLMMLLLQPASKEATSNTVGSSTKQLYWITSK